MNQSKFEMLKTVSTHKYWLSLTLAGAFFCFFALNRGGLVVFINLTLFFLILNILTGQYQVNTIPVAYWITTSICAYLLIVSILVSPHESHYSWMRNILRMIVIVFAIHCLNQKKIDDQITLFFGIILSLAVSWQFAVFHLFSKQAGTFTNIHQLACFTALVLPIVFYFFWITNGWYKYFLIIFGLMAIDLMLRTGSRPAFVGITFGALFVILFLVKGRNKLYGVTLLFLTLVVLFVTDYANMASRLNELIAVLPEEERLQLWSKAWNILMENSLLEWIFGHGIGWFTVCYTHPPFPDVTAVSPHNYFLDLIYSNGITGFILVVAGLIILISLVIKATRRDQHKKIRVISKLLIVMFITWLFICGLNFPLYSKYSLYPFAFILGTMLVVIKSKESKPKEHGLDLPL